MKQQLLYHKSNIFDGSMVAGGAAYTVFAESLPIIIGVVTLVLFLLRIYTAWQEIRINKRALEKGKNIN